MRILESSIIGKAGADACEDGLVITPDFVAVIDGSTSKTPYRFDSTMSNGRFAMTLVSEYIRSMSPGTTVEEFCEAATARLCWLYEEHHLEEEMALRPDHRPTCSVIVYSSGRDEIWMIGDCQCLIDGRYYDNPKPIEEENAEKRSRRIHQLLASGEADVASLRRDDIGRQAIQEGLFEATRQQNKTFAVIDGTAVLMSGVKIIKTSEAKEIILASDGYPFLKPTLAESEEALRQLLERDPLLIRDFKATKAWMEGRESFDDRTYVRVGV